MLACATIAYIALSRRTPESVFQNHSASYWLRAVFGVKGQQHQALAAFRRMGTNADPVLVAAIQDRETPLARLYRHIFPQLPRAIQERLTQPNDPQTLRSAAELVLLNVPSSQIAPKLLPLLKELDSAVRLAVLNSVQNFIGPADIGQAPMVLLAAKDPDADVRMRAALALWKITGQTNTAIPVLETTLNLTQDAVRRHWAACYLLEMGKSDPLLTVIFMNSLTNGQPGVRMSACSCLGRIGPSAAAAIPSLRNALHDPQAEVRRRAEMALRAIDPKHAVTNSP